MKKKAGCEQQFVLEYFVHEQRWQSCRHPSLHTHNTSRFEVISCRYDLIHNEPHRSLLERRLTLIFRCLGAVLVRHVSSDGIVLTYVNKPPWCN